MSTTKKARTGTKMKGKSCVLKPGYRYVKGGRVVKAKSKTSCKPCASKKTK
jgi:hypothetical protein